MGNLVAVGPLFTSAFVPMSEQFGVSLQRFTLGNTSASTM